MPCGFRLLPCTRLRSRRLGRVRCHTRRASTSSERIIEFWHRRTHSTGTFFTITRETTTTRSCCLRVHGGRRIGRRIGRSSKSRWKICRPTAFSAVAYSNRSFLGLVKSTTLQEKNMEFIRVLEDGIQLPLRKWVALPLHMSL